MTKRVRHKESGREFMYTEALATLPGFEVFEFTEDGAVSEADQAVADAKSRAAAARAAKAAKAGQ